MRISRLVLAFSVVGSLLIAPMASPANAGTPVGLDIVGSNAEIVYVDAGDPVGCTGELVAEVVWGNLAFISSHPIVSMPSPGVVQVDTNNALSVVAYVALNTGFAPLDFAICVGP
jgi:hypothetical protein